MRLEQRLLPSKAINSVATSSKAAEVQTLVGAGDGSRMGNGAKFGYRTLFIPVDEFVKAGTAMPALKWDSIDAANRRFTGISDGSMYDWGWNDGPLINDVVLVPNKIEFDDWISGVSGTGIRDGGKLYSWGTNANGATGLNTNVGNTVVPTQVGSFSDWTHVAIGQDYRLGIRDGKLYSWGSNLWGGTGLNTTVGNTLVPTQVGSFSDWTHVAAAEGFIARRQASSFNVSFGIRDGGKLYSWGGNGLGATGQNTTVGNTLVPTQVGSFSDWTHISCAWSAAFGIRDEKLYSWGSNLKGGTGQNTGVGNTLVPTQVGTDTGWTHVSVGGAITDGRGSNATLAIRNGMLFAIGCSDSSLGTPLDITVGLLVPTQVGTRQDWLKASIGLSSSYGVVGVDL